MTATLVLPQFDTVGEPYLQAYFVLTSNRKYAQMALGRAGSPTVSICVKALPYDKHIAK